MRILRMIKLFILMNSKTKKILLEAFLFLAWARIMKRKPFGELVPILGLEVDETPSDIQESEKDIREISIAIQLASKYTFWESMCLVRALAGLKMLERRKLESTLYLGTSKDKNGKLIAHAWLRCGRIYISGQETMNDFTVVGKFAKKIRCFEGAN
ncbi:lasso peptide biosynthesis B2 protein [Robertmurraya sp.]|uniref:lasso peptide biosynthesis B2 protein n=1 Tax=Robertmurraya sp. TaxID=2837525 RepID=UPI003703D93D